jgi:glycosyltransferase involved in cell wall biosynthesis
LYGAFDLLALPSHREGLPRAAMEAAAMGLPIVTTNVRGCRQVVVDGSTGLVVALGDADGLARAIRQLVEAPDVRAAMGVAARARAVAAFDERVVIDLILRTYERLLDERRPAASAR